MENAAGSAEDPVMPCQYPDSPCVGSIHPCHLHSQPPLNLTTGSALEVHLQPCRGRGKSLTRVWQTCWRIGGRQEAAWAFLFLLLFFSMDSQGPICRSWPLDWNKLMGMSQIEYPFLVTFLFLCLFFLFFFFFSPLSLFPISHFSRLSDLPATESFA